VPFYPPNVQPAANNRFSRGFVLVQNGAGLIMVTNPFDAVWICN